MTDLKVLPPSPNWNSPKACDTSEETNLFVYATNELLVLLNLQTLAYVGCLAGHRDRVNALEICETLCVSASNDKTVRCWDLVSLKEISLLEGHKSDILSVAWTTSKELIISGDKSGEIMAWNRKANKKGRFSLLKSPIYCISASPTHSDTLAFGFQNGSILIVTVGLDFKQTILYNLQGHDMEIHSLSWQGTSENIQDGRYTYLASGSRDRTIRIWNVPDEQAVKTITLPQQHQQLTDQQKARLWLALAWIKGGNKIITSSFMGNLMLWDIDLHKPQYQWFTKGHNRSVFSIHVLFNGTKAITISMDRQIIQWQLLDLRPSLVLPCLCLGVHSLDISFADPSKLALGLGDSTIRVWNNGNPEIPFDSITLWRGLKSQVTCIKWHPAEEGKLVFGDALGVFGLMDVYTEKCKNFHSHHKGKVYALDWCKKQWLSGEEASDQGEKGIFVFSCGGDGTIYMSDTSKPTKASVNINQLIENANFDWVQKLKGSSSEFPHRTEVAIHPRGRYLAVGNKDGSIEVFELPSFKIVYHFNGHRDIINQLQWHDKGDGASCLLASGSNDCKVMVHDFSDLEKLASTVSVPTSTCLRILGKHTNGISSLSWCPADHTKLVSTSFDRTAIVWDINDAKPVSIFCGHRGRILSSAWSLLDDDLIFTGGDDQMCFAWRPSQHPYNEKANSVVASTPLDETLREQSRKHGGRTSKKSKSRNLFPSSTLPVSRQILQNDIMELAKRLYKGEREKAMDFWTKSAPKNKKVAEKNDLEEGSSSTLSELLFGDRKDVRKVTQSEVESHTNMGTSATMGGLEDVNLGVPLDMWSNNLSGLIERIQQEEFLQQDWLILALSPLAGKDVWESLLRRQAQKLSIKNEYHLAVMCYLACGDVYEALNVYRRAKLYREAITLAKLRLPQEDSVLLDIYSEWAVQLESQKRYEEAALCHLASQKPSSIQHALNNLARQGDPSSLRASACLALLLGDESAQERMLRYQQDRYDREGMANLSEESDKQTVSGDLSVEKL